MYQAIHVNVPYSMLLKNLDFILEKELNPEIYFDGEAIDTFKENDAHSIKRALTSKELSITIHAPFMDLSPGAVDTKIRKATWDRLYEILHIAAFFLPKLIVFHPGYNKWFFDGNVNLWLENSLTTWQPVAKTAEKLGIPLAVENIFEEEPFGLSQLIAGVNSPTFNFCFDTGHFHLFSTVPMEAWFISLGPYIREVHLHDNCKASDDHLPMGDGDIDFALFFHLIKRYSVNPIYTIEPHKVEDLERSLEMCNHFITQREGR
jgi:sugar phosphate isomerase/epimerase